MSKAISQLPSLPLPAQGTDFIHVSRGSLDFKAKKSDFVDGGIEKKVYKALISQSGTSNPTVTVLENTIDPSFIFVRNSVGVYSTPSGLTPEEKTFFLPIQQLPIAYVVDGVISGYAKMGMNGNSVVLSTFDSDFLPSDDILIPSSSYGQPILIEVYP